MTEIRLKSEYSVPGLEFPILGIEFQRKITGIHISFTHAHAACIAYMHIIGLLNVCIPNSQALQEQKW